MLYVPLSNRRSRPKVSSEDYTISIRRYNNRGNPLTRWIVDVHRSNGTYVDTDFAITRRGAERVGKAFARADASGYYEKFKRVDRMTFSASNSDSERTKQ
jgi:hypothetical protein